MSALYRRQLATLAIGLLCEFDDRHRGDEDLREWVRASLIRWQLSLRGDGRPADRRMRHSPLHHAVAALIIQLLTDTGCFHTDLLLNDIERQVQWLAKRPSQTPWIEATTVSALADGALLLRDRSLLAEARGRLRCLLSRQDDEGWFPERGGADVGRLSLTIDALARVYQQGRWGELNRPLANALRFLTHFVHPDGSVGGCYGSCETGFLSPYGVELLAQDYADAEALALVARRQYESFAADRLAAWHDDLCALQGSRIALAAANASAELPPTCRYPCDTVGRFAFPHAGLSIFTTETYHAVAAGHKGGSLHVTWRSGRANLEDSGLNVVFPHKMVTAGRWSSRSQHRADESSVTSNGVLRRPLRTPDSKRHRIREWARRMRFDKPRPSASANNKDHRRGKIDSNRLTHNRFHRQITFGDDWIRIQDRVLCRPPCRTIMCQSPPSGPANPYVDRPLAGQAFHGPIIVEGGRNVQITRVYRDGELVDQAADPAD